MSRSDDWQGILPITNEEIMDFFSSESLLEALDKTAAYTYSTGYESGFLAERGIRDNKIKITEIMFSGPQSLTFAHREAAKSTRIKHLYPGREHREVSSQTPGHYRFLGFHFHPEAHGPPKPSEQDLLSVNGPLPLYAEVSEWSVRPIQGVGLVDNKREVEILLYQKSFVGEFCRADAQELFNQIHPLPSNDVVKNLQESGYFRVELMRYLKKSTGYSVHRDDLRKLASFVYTPGIKIKSYIMDFQIK